MSGRRLVALMTSDDGSDRPAREWQQSGPMKGDDVGWLADRLPPRIRAPIRCEADYYGASSVIASAVGRPEPPKSTAYWTHGWIGQELRHPRQYARGEPGDRHLVATDRHAAFLRQAGFRRVEAVGLPIVYVEDRPIERLPNSLLIMPPHSLPYTKHSWREREYVDLIVQLRKQFSCVVTCVNRYCVDSGVWTDALRQRGIPWIVGADLEDRNCLLRMSRTFRSFDFMTTNAIGSHVAYAAYFGCRVSVHGPLEVPREEDYRNDPWYRKYPEVLHLNLESAQEARVRERWPWLFCEPGEAAPGDDWGREMVGERFKRPAREIARLLGWSAVGRFVETVRESRRRVERWPGRLLNRVQRMRRGRATRS